MTYLYIDYSIVIIIHDPKGHKKKKKNESDDPINDGERKKNWQLLF